MSSTNVTEFYGLTQYAGSDKPSFTDNNEAFRAIDAALHGAVAGVEDASDAVTALTGRVGDVEEAVTGLSGTVGTQGDAITALQNKEISQDGDIAEVKAAALDMVCAFNEEAAQSVHAYAIGDFFRYNDVLYKASAVINIGDTIIPNTNCVATNVTEQLLTDVDKVGDLSSLTTTDKTSAVAAINEAVSDVGDLSSLTTTDKTSAVAAINEVKSALSDELIATGSGTTYAAQLSSLKTSFDNLTYDQKKCAYLKLANVVANVNNIVGIFGYFGLGATDGNFNSLRLNDSKYYSMAVSNGVITHNDYSSRNISKDITGNIELHVIH